MSVPDIVAALVGLGLAIGFFKAVFAAQREREEEIARYRKYDAQSKEEADQYAERLRKHWP